jgi:hypothetical protein
MPGSKTGKLRGGQRLIAIFGILCHNPALAPPG